MCKKLTAAAEGAEKLFQLLRDSREKKPAVHLITTIVSLFTLAWIGTAVDNFFLVKTFICFQHLKAEFG